MAFADLRSAYALDTRVVVADLPEATVSLIAECANGERHAADRTGAAFGFTSLPAGTHAFVARSATGEILAEEFSSILRHPGERPIMAFATSLGAESVPRLLEWLRALRCTVVQIYNWMERYSAPLPRSGSYRDPLGRELERDALEALIAGVRELGAVAQAYAPVYASDNDYAAEHRELVLYRNDDAPETLGDLLTIMNPADPAWQAHWLEVYGTAADRLGFNGFHLDSYGYPRCARDASGDEVSVEAGYASFLNAFRRARANDLVSFNQVNGVPSGLRAASAPSFRYVEVWPPNGDWRHLEGLLARSSGGVEDGGAAFAIYPPVWSQERASALRTVLLTEAVTTSLGASLLVWGDDRAALRHPYYVDHERLEHTEAEEVLVWHRFALRCRDLFLGGLDTSWTDIGDENGAVSVVWDGLTSPEPVAGALCARVVRSRDLVAIGLVDLSGSVSGSWTSGTGVGLCRQAEVSVLVDRPGEWTAELAVLGESGGRFQELTGAVVSQREGQALCFAAALGAGWSVLRLRRVDTADEG